MKDKRVKSYEDLQILVSMLQLARRRAEYLRQAEILTVELAQLRSQCNTELRQTLDRLTLSDVYRDDLEIDVANRISIDIDRN